MQTVKRTTFLVFVTAIILSACGTAPTATGPTNALGSQGQAFHPEGFEGVDASLQTDFDPLLAGQEAPVGYRSSLDRDAIFPVYEPTFNLSLIHI